jgi:SAM-dependent methyltransferase
MQQQIVNPTYYDIVYQGYDYELDVETLSRFCETGGANFSNLLEIGCGTAKHTALLARKFENVFAIDIDSAMVKKAEQYLSELEIKNVSLFHLSALELPTIDLPLCSVACAFFNVINYILDFESLVKLFSNVAQSLVASGIYIFDCLDTSQAYQEQSFTHFKYDLNEIKITRDVKSFYDTKSKMLKVDETYTNFMLHSSASYKQVYRLWDRDEIIQALEQANLELILCDNKKSVNSNYKKQNQLIYFVKKG